MAQTGESNKNKSENKNANKSGSTSTGQPSKGGSGVPDESQNLGGDNELDSHGNTRGQGDRVSSPAQQRSGAGGGKSDKETSDMDTDEDTDE